MRDDYFCAALTGLLASGKDGTNSIAFIVNRALAYAEEAARQIK